MKHSKLLNAAIAFAVVGSVSAGAQSADMGPTIVDGTIPASLTGKAGDAANGRKIAINRKKGNCLACHVMPIPEQQFHGLTGTDLNGVSSRISEAELRMRLVDAKVINEDTMMPSFFKTGQHRVLKKFEGKTILSAQEVEDVIAYVMTIK
ncbi:sulfur oxidation c-type cytochrome SoxX [Pseudomonadota bacterium]